MFTREILDYYNNSRKNIHKNFYRSHEQWGEDNDKINRNRH